MSFRPFAIFMLASFTVPASAVTIIDNMPGAPDPGLPAGFLSIITFD